MSAFSNLEHEVVRLRGKVAALEAVAHAPQPIVTAEEFAAFKDEVRKQLNRLTQFC